MIWRKGSWVGREEKSPLRKEQPKGTSVYPVFWVLGKLLSTSQGDVTCARFQERGVGEMAGESPSSFPALPLCQLTCVFVWQTEVRYEGVSISI